jgi:hypothetical protein
VANSRERTFTADAETLRKDQIKVNPESAEGAEDAERHGLNKFLLPWTMDGGLDAHEGDLLEVHAVVARRFGAGKFELTGWRYTR